MHTDPCEECFNPGTPGFMSTKGDGKCANCYGSGQTGEQQFGEMLVGIHEECPKCDGSGVCQNCGGSGWLD